MHLGDMQNELTELKKQYEAFIKAGGRGTFSSFVANAKAAK